MSSGGSEDEVAQGRVGKLVGGRFRLTGLLGSGGMAAVYRAVGPAGEAVAIKILHPEMARRRDVKERFVREAYVANQVRHPGAVAVLEHGSDDEPYLVMEFLDGEALSQRVKERGLPLPELLGVLDSVLDVLVVAHEAGIIHRDIKPDNLFLCSDGRVEVLDFGLARMIDELPGDFKTRTGLALGTLPYMPPEQALGRRDQLDGRVDLFALGASAFRILAGRRVHEAPSEAELLMAMATKPAPPLLSVAPNVPRDVAAIIDLSLAFAKEARYPDARTMQLDVRAAREGRTPPYAVGQRVQTARDDETRVDVAAPLAAAVAFGTAQDSASPVSVAKGSVAAASAGWDAAPASMAAPTVAFAPPNAPSAPPARTSRGPLLWVVLMLGGAFGLLMVVVTAAVLWGRTAEAEATKDPPAAAATEPAVLSQVEQPAEADSAAEADEPTAEPPDPRDPPATAPNPVPTPAVARVAPAPAPAAAKPAPAPTATAALESAPAPVATATPQSKDKDEGKSNGKGKGKEKSQGKGRDR